MNAWNHSKGNKYFVSYFLYLSFILLLIIVPLFFIWRGINKIQNSTFERTVQRPCRSTCSASFQNFPQLDAIFVKISFNPRPAGPLDFPPPAGGGGGVWAPPPMISAPGCRRGKRKAAFESSRKIISKLFRSFFGSGQNWGHQGSKFQNFPKQFFDNKIVNFTCRATNLTPSCLSR